MLVKDIYNKEVVSIHKDESIEEVARLMAEKGVGGLPVVDGEGSLVGMITEKDLLARHKKIMPIPYIDVLGAFIYLEDPERANVELKKSLATKVEEVMSTPVISLSPDDEIETALEFIVTKGFNRIPVESEGKLIGIIARNDVLRAITNKPKEE